MTPAQIKGLVVGQDYLYQSNGDMDDLDGTYVKFRSDDATNSPSFFVPTSVDGDGWMFLSLDNITVQPKGGENPTFSVSVENGRTTVTFGKELTAEQAAKVLAAAGIK